MTHHILERPPLLFDAERRATAERTRAGSRVELVNSPRKPARLPVKTTRGAGYLVVEARLLAKLRGAKKPWRLRVKLRATRLGGATAVATTVVQKRRR